MRLNTVLNLIQKYETGSVSKLWYRSQGEETKKTVTHMCSANVSYSVGLSDFEIDPARPFSRR